jgi:hypothetical protein
VEQWADGESLPDLHLGRKFVIGRCAVVLALLGALIGCTGACTNSGVEGSYELSAKGVNYGLQLRADGAGTLSASGKLIGDLRWILSEAPGQQILELDAAGATYATLTSIVPKHGGPDSPIVASSGVLGPVPECSRNGRMTKLVLNFDEDIAFRRSGN